MKTKTRLRAVPVFLVALTVCLTAANAQKTVDAAKIAQHRDARPDTAATYNVKAFGAKGDGKTLDTPAINEAIARAAAGGGGTVRFPARTYLCFSIRLKSNIALYLDHGATILAADSKQTKGSYD